MSRPNTRLRREVRGLYAAGRLARGRWMHTRSAESGCDHTLISIRRKYGGAVSRNRARRQLRAICREFLPNGHPGRILLISLGDRSQNASFQDLRSDLRSALRTLGFLDR